MNFAAIPQHGLALLLRQMKSGDGSGRREFAGHLSAFGPATPTIRDDLQSPVAAGRGFIDDVIMPSETRPRACRALRRLRSKQLDNPWKKHGNIPL